MIFLTKLKVFNFITFLLLFILIISCSQNPKEKTCKELYGIMKDCYYANTFQKNPPCDALSYLAYKTALKEGKSRDIANIFKDACYFGCHRYQINFKLPTYNEFKNRFCEF